MDWFFGYSTYIEFYAEITFYSAIALFLLFSGQDHNIRWLAVLMSLFYLVDKVGLLILESIELSALQGWIIHIYHLGMNLFFIWLIFERPFISCRVSGFVSRYFSQIAILGPSMQWLLPAGKDINFYRQEVALIKVIRVACWAHALMILHYVLFHFGIAADNGWFMEIGLNRRVVFQVGYSMLILTLIAEVVVLIYLILEVVARRLTNSLSKGF